jgi:Flp pilus assembly protein TadD
MLSNKAIEEGNLVQAEKNLEIYRMVDPTNPEHAYLSAVVAMKNGDEAAAIDFLNQAILLGFNNLARFMQEPAFVPIENKSDLLKMMI